MWHIRSGVSWVGGAQNIFPTEATPTIAAKKTRQNVVLSRLPTSALRRLSLSKEKDDAGKDAPEAVFSSPRLTRKFPSKSNQQKKWFKKDGSIVPPHNCQNTNLTFPLEEVRVGRGKQQLVAMSYHNCVGEKKKSALWAKLCGAKEKLINKFSASRSACQCGFVNEYLWVVVCIRAKISGVCRLVVLYEDFFFFWELVEDCKICIL